MKDYTGIDLDDIVFEGRNRLYGAYVLRKQNDDTLIRSAGLMMGLLALALLIPALWTTLDAHVEEDSWSDPVTLHTITPPTAPKPQMPQAASAPLAGPKAEPNSSAPPEVNPDTLDSPPRVPYGLPGEGPSSTPSGGKGGSGFGGDIGGTGTGEGGGAGDGFSAPPLEEVFQLVEQMPEFPGGNTEMIRFMQREIKYPESARNSETQGRVYVSFVVSQDGSLSDIKAERGPGFGLDEEAVRVVKKMPKWNPGQNNGRSVKVRMVIPVNFRLN